MLRLGLRLTLRSGREALARLLVTAAAVLVGVGILLAVLADFNAFTSANNRACWECTTGPVLAGTGTATPASGAELWNYGNDIYAGQTIERLEVAALGPGAPVPPGVTRLPGPGQYDASPALARLLRTVPRAELGARYPGRLAGTIGQAALTGPQELVIYVGRTPAQLTSAAQTIRVTRIATHSGKQIWSPFFRDLFVAAAIAFLFPILVLIGTATRLAAARLEARYAALRLVGSTSRQISVIAAVDAFLSALLGTVAGFAVFAAVRPALADTAITSQRYFPGHVALTAADYAVVLVAVPVASAAAALLSLRRVRISPLGVSRRVTPPPPGAWQLAPLGAGALVFAAGSAVTSNRGISPLIYLGLLLVMVGLLVGGPYLTERASRGLRRLAGGPAALLAARRLSDNPKAAFRSVRGLVLAVFLGTVVAGVLPAVNAMTASSSAQSLSSVLTDQFTSAPVCGNDVNCSGGGDTPSVASRQQAQIGLNGLPPSASRPLLGGLRAIAGATVVPLWTPPGNVRGPDVRFGPGGQPPPDGVMTCAGLRELAALGRCAPGRTAVEVQADGLFSDNPGNSLQGIATASSPAAPRDYASLPLQAVLVKVSSPAALERVRTYLATHTPLSESGSAPRTYGEAVGARLGLADTVERLIFIAVALTLLVAGCSLAVAAAGGLMERRRPFSLLRVTGTQVATLYKVVLLETALPLAVATALAAGAAYGIAVLTVGRLSKAGAPVPAPGGDYYALMGIGLAVSLGVILLTLPLLRRMTSPASARFE